VRVSVKSPPRLSHTAFVPYLVGGEVDDLKGVLDNADSENLLAVVAALLHERDGEALDDGALGLLEALACVAASGVGEVNGTLALDGNVILKGDVLDLDVVKGPAAKELDLQE